MPREFDPTPERSDESKAAEQAALEIGEKLEAAAKEDQERKFQRDEESNELIGGKFRSQEDLLKAYQELEKKQSQGEEEPAAEAEEEPAEEAPEVPPTEAALTRASEEYAKGELTDETIEELSKMDSKDLIKAYVEFYSKNQQQQAVQVEAQSIYDSVGGEEQYQSMVQWAASNLSADEISAYNEVTNTGSAAAVKFAVESLSNRYKNAEGYEAPLVTGSKSAPKVQGYRSHAELVADIGDPRYERDPAFRADVEAKLARSPDLL
jgi:intein/homing endonuclease|tara:strand:- start:1089 stop:1883 length:795 start_codon:yes stop_codon:yes gene_type:complete